MPKQAFIDFRAVKQAVTMQQVLEHYQLLDQFKKSRDSLNGPCPLHGGTNPTQFRISLSKNIWNCFGDCKHGGNTLDFVAKMEQISIHAAATKMIEWFRLNLPGASSEVPKQQERKRASPSSATKTLKRQQQDEENLTNKPLTFRLEKLDPRHPYLSGRGLLPETIAEFGIGYCSKGLLAGRIAIPIHDSKGNLVAYAGRWPGEPPEDTPKYKLPPGFRKSLEFFNIHRALKEAPDAPVVIVEGFFDCMKLHQNGCRKAIALMGSTLSPEQEALLRANLGFDSRVLLMLDEDEAGRTARADMAVRISSFCYVSAFELGADGKQPDDLTSVELSTRMSWLSNIQRASVFPGNPGDPERVAANAP